MPVDFKRFLILVLTAMISCCGGLWSFAQSGNHPPKELQAIAEKFQTSSGSTPYQKMLPELESGRDRNNRKTNGLGNIRLVSGNKPVEDYEIDQSRLLSQGGSNPLRQDDSKLSFVQKPNEVPPHPIDESVLDKRTRPIRADNFADETITRQVSGPSRVEPSGSGLTKPSQLPKPNQSGLVRRVAVGLDDEEAEYNELVNMIESYESEETDQEDFVDESQISRPDLTEHKQIDSSYMNEMLPPPKERTESDKNISFNPGSQIMSVVSVLGSLCLVLGVFFMFVLFMKKIGPKSGGNLPKEAFENVGRYPLNQKLQLNLLRLGNRLMLVASTTDGGVETLTEIDHPDEVVQILAMCRRLDPNSSTSQFQTVLNEFAKEKPPTEPQTLSSLLSNGSLYG